MEIGYETVRAWSNRFGPMFANEIKRKAVSVDAGRAAMEMAR
jgi:hypothetical protein